MIKRIFRLFIVITAMYGYYAMPAQAGVPVMIPDGDCAFTILKITPQVESAPFDFVRTVDGVETQLSLLSNDTSFSDIVFVGQGGTVAYTELPTEGWTLQEIQCFEGAGVNITKTENSVTFECEQPSGELSLAFCAFFNRISADKIPTLSEWGMIAAAAGLGLIGLFFALKKRRSQAV